MSLAGSETKLSDLHVLGSEGLVARDRLHFLGDDSRTVHLGLAAEWEDARSLDSSRKLGGLLSLSNSGLGLSWVNNKVSFVNLESLGVDIDALAAQVGSTVVDRNTNALGLCSVQASSL